MIIFNNPKELLRLYLKFNRIVFKLMIFLLMAIAGLSFVASVVSNIYIAFVLSWPGLNIDASILIEFLTMIGSVIKNSIMNLWKLKLNLLFSATYSYFCYRFILVFEGLSEKISKSTFEVTFSNQSNLKEIIKSLWIIQGLNLIYLVIEPWIGLSRTSSSDSKHWAYTIVSYLELLIDFITINFSGLTPLLFLLIIEIIHRMAKKNHALEDEVGGLV